ncbi:hypothetical protein C0J52_22930 [Blattella germanica]|nr:hypothetical protein C0J52_22930 [Blattella germanica]
MEGKGLLVRFYMLASDSHLSLDKEVNHHQTSKEEACGLPKQNLEFTTWKKSHDILKTPLVIFTRDDYEDEVQGYFAKGGLSSIVSDPHAKNIFESLKTDDTALLLNPYSLTETDWNELENSPFGDNARTPSLITLGILLASTIGIPWLFGTSSKKNTTSTDTTTPPPTFKYGHLDMLYNLEISETQIRVLENLHELPSSLSEE